jgi:hypothetical protein
MSTLEGNESALGGMTVVNQGRGKYIESAIRGALFGCCNQSGVTSQAGLSGTTPVLALYNPPGSGVNVALIYAGANILASAATVGAVWVAQHQATAAAAAVSAVGTLLVTRRLFVPIAAAISGQATAHLAGTATTPIALATLGVMKTGAITTIPEIQTLGRWFDGAIVLAPGAALSIQTGVASGTNGLMCEYIWEEISI